MFYKKSYFKNSAILTGKHQCWSLFQITLQDIKKRLQQQVPSCEYCEIFTNSYFEEHLWAAAS